MRLPRLLVAALALSALGSFATPARAQLSIGRPSWNNRAPGNRLETQINRQDCLNDATVSFTTTFATPPQGGTFELWAGTGCVDSMNRSNNNGCVQVGLGSVAERQITVRVQDLVKAFTETTEGTVASCDIASGEGKVGRTLFFLVVDGSAMVSVQGMPDWAYEYDVTAPPPPTGVKAGSGERSLIVDFTASTEAMLDSYRFYCAPADSDCGAAALVPAAAPDEATFCGRVEAQGAGSGTTDAELSNNMLYAVGVASTDAFGNVGVLSSVACGTPKDVTGFYEAYRAAGGTAGGGFCSFALPRRADVAFAGLLMLGALVLWRRRR